MTADELRALGNRDVPASPHHDGVRTHPPNRLHHIELDVEQWALLEDAGPYDARVVFHRRTSFGKIVFAFEIRTGLTGEQAANDGKVVPFFCTMPGKHGKVTHGSKLFQAWVTALGRKPYRRDRFSTRAFYDKLFRITVRTTGDPPKYSVVDTIERAR